MARDGTKSGGRKKGSSQKLTTLAREAALATGLLPHEWLLKVSRGEMMKQRRLVIKYHLTGPNKGQEKSREWIEEDWFADADTRIEAAKAAAPFYAPKLAVQTINTPNDTSRIAEALEKLAKELPG